MKLTHEIKRMLDALAFANVGENLNRRQKSRAIAGSAAPAAPAPQVAVTAAHLPQVGLYLGSELPADVMQYVVQTCVRLKHGLTVLTFQSELEARALLAPFQATLDAAGLQPRVTVLTGEPPASLIHALRKRPDVAFLICNESGYFGRGLLKGTVRQDAIPVPVVMVASSEAATQPNHSEAGVAHERAA
ncbi:MAG: hypothetical protein ACLGG4_03470 [Gammaproteobacteria bacterium]